MNWNAESQVRLAYINQNTREDMKNDSRIKELAESALKTCANYMKTLKEQGALFEKEDLKGNTRTVAMSVRVMPRVDKDAEPTRIRVNGKIQESYPELKDKEGNTLYTVTGNITAKDGSALSILFSNRINEDGTVNATSVSYTKFANKKKVEGAKGVEDIKNSKAPNEIKVFVDALDKNGFIKNYSDSELSNLAFHLNKDVFKEKVMIEIEKNGKMEDVEKKLVNASYSNSPEYGEQITIFNKSPNEADKNVTVKLYEKDGEIVAYASNSALTYVEGIGIVPKTSEEDKSAFKYIYDANDIVNFLPDIDELRMAVAEVKNIDWEEVQEAKESVAEDVAEKSEEDVDGFTEVEGDIYPDDLPF